MIARFAKIFIISLVLSTSAFAKHLTWAEVDSNQKYFLSQPIVFTNEITIVTETAFDWLGADQAGEAPVLVYRFQATSCEFPESSHDMVLLQPHENPTNHDNSVGVVLHPDCIIDIYVEGRDYLNPSIFHL